ncbi:S1 family peptidase [Nostoc sp. CALU 546]|uniref:S1 family peptidase n=1 Tax=Nostoc sp. CALU 546 TaxID=1867241 RepID=UPI003B67F41A
MFYSIHYRSFLALLIISLLSGLSSYSSVQAVSLSEDDVNDSTQSVTRHSEVEVSLLKIAKQVTVRILTNSGTGSGVIIKRDRQTYTVLTNHHVVADSPEKGYQVITCDGQLYQARGISQGNFGSLDLALVEFTSNLDYQVVVFGKSQAFSDDEIVYSAGFPAWHFTFNEDIITKFEETRSWGIKAFKLTTGNLKTQLQKTLVGGYKIGYTNDVIQGMSGGPLLNQNGELIAINGLLKYPFQGIKALTFTDGTVPDEQLFQQMEALSWAIPITDIHSLLTKQKILNEFGL